MIIDANIAEGLAILVTVPVVLLLSGAGLVAPLQLQEPGERVAAALLAGLGMVLLGLGWIGALQPIRGGALALGAGPALFTLFRPAVRRQLIADSAAVLRHWPGVVGAIVFLGLLLWPLLARSALMYYDGTANHDGHIWISGAEALQRTSYLAPFVGDKLHPYLNGTVVIQGWKPDFGRIAAEAYIAAVATVSGKLPVEVYLWATAALYFPWLAAVYAVARRFICGPLTSPAILGLVAFQPLFAFYHLNGNLPNLLGVLSGFTLLLALQGGFDRIAREGRAGWGWLGGAAVAGHGMLISYPEVAPFIGLSAVLLAMRAWRRQPAQARALAVFVGGAALAALAMNPATTSRAVFGFITAWGAARSDQTWANLMSGVSGAGFWPTLLTLSPKAGRELGALGGALVTAGLLAACVWTGVRARDRSGTLILLSGAAALAGYTLAADFNYGWQKTAQFSGVILAAVVSVGAPQALAAWPTRRAVRGVALGLLGAFFVYATVIIQMDQLKWSRRKHLERDWLALRAQTFAGPVWVVPATFDQPFFYGMWATYFLPQTPIAFPDASSRNTGYLVDTVATAADLPEPPAATLVGAAWAARRFPETEKSATGSAFRLLPGRIDP